MKQDLEFFIDMVTTQAEDMRDSLDEVRSRLGKMDVALNLSVSRLESLTQRIEEVTRLATANA